jgi:two-component system nitrogen regulation response regulator NtrX
MPLETQGKLLRVLQEQRFTRLGGDQRIEVDVRVIATTNRDLKTEMTAGRFREDLYYRLAVVPLPVPPLAARRTDIPELVGHFMELAARTMGTAPRRFTEDAMAVLQTASWPGDVRQLKNVIEWSLIMAPADPARLIDTDGLPPELTASATAVMDPSANSDLVSLPLREARERFERSYLHAQLQRFGGNISRTANFVGMERSALHRKLKSLGLNSDD